jgi:hypothetical protein
MRSARFVVMVLVTFAAGLTVSARQAQKAAAPNLATVLAEAGTFLDRYAASFGALACIERSREIAEIGAPGGRTVRSDVVLLSVGPAKWFTFRDAFEVDGEPLRSRDTRLVDALGGPPSTAIENARRIETEGTKRHLYADQVNRAITAPLLALMFLATENQPRSDFTFEGMKSIDGMQAGLVRFKEHARPRVLPAADEAAAEGRFWIQPGTGRVVQTELSMTSTGPRTYGTLGRTVTAKITVRYGEPSALGVWAPIRRDEEFNVNSQTGQIAPGRASSASQTITGRVDYSDFRKLSIDVHRIVR